MGKEKHYKSTHARAKLIKALTERYYERENNAKCYKAVWKKYINPIYPMSYRTYLNYLNIPPDPPTHEDAQQPDLFGTLE
jgi:hypothetical protein